MINNTRALLLIVCTIAYLLPAYGQSDTAIPEGINPKYEHVSILPENFYRGTRNLLLTFKVPNHYLATEGFVLEDPPADPKEVLKIIGRTFVSKWIHKDGECILFIECSGLNLIECGRIHAPINKSIDELPQFRLNCINYRTGVGKYNLVDPTEKEMKKLKKIINIWSRKKAKKTFNAHYVITYPIKDKKAVYMEKYTLKLGLTMIKWGQFITISFFVTEKGNKNIKKYIKDVEEAFWFTD